MSKETEYALGLEKTIKRDDIVEIDGAKRRVKAIGSNWIETIPVGEMRE